MIIERKTIVVLLNFIIYSVYDIYIVKVLKFYKKLQIEILRFIPMI